MVDIFGVILLVSLIFLVGTISKRILKYALEEKEFSEDAPK